MKRHQAQSWPRLLRDSHQTGCHFCDTLFKLHPIKEGEKADCATCGQILYHNGRKSLEYSVAFAITGILLFMLFLFFPFMRLNAQGNTVMMNVLEAVEHIWVFEGTVIAILVILFALILPLLQLVLLLYICIPLLVDKTVPGMIICARILLGVRPWVMLEVFFFGAVVSLIKIVKLADVDLLCGFWSLIAVMFCIAGTFAAMDKLELWDRIEVSRFKRKDPLST